MKPSNALEDAMLEEDLLQPLLTEDDLPYSDEKPVDNELQLLAPGLLRAILAYLWADRQDWFLGVNMGIYYDTREPAIGPDAFLSLGVPRVRSAEKLRLSYVIEQEQVMPQWVLEIVSQKPGGEYVAKFERYQLMGVLYYTIYNPGHTKRDRHEVFEVYKLVAGQYVRQLGNPVWMPEIGLGIGHERGTQEGITRDWLYWYDASGQRHLPPENAVAQERVLREQERLMRREIEEQLAKERIQAQAALQAERLESAMVLEQERRSVALKMLEENIPLDTIVRITTFTIEELEGFRSEHPSP
jgi:Uma2 family endonuclease